MLVRSWKNSFDLDRDYHLVEFKIHSLVQDLQHESLIWSATQIHTRNVYSRTSAQLVFKNTMSKATDNQETRNNLEKTITKVPLSEIISAMINILTVWDI